MSGPANVMMGDMDEPTKLPETQVPDEELAEEKKLAKYSQTAEFKRLREFMEARIKFYQRFLPNGSQVEGDPNDPNAMIKVNLPSGVSSEMLSTYWMTSCIVTKEFENILSEYARAHEVVEDAERQGR